MWPDLVTCFYLIECGKDDEVSLSDEITRDSNYRLLTDSLLLALMKQAAVVECPCFKERMVTSRQHPARN